MVCAALSTAGRNLRADALAAGEKARAVTRDVDIARSWAHGRTFGSWRRRLLFVWKHEIRNA